jgi:hypothetical protein
MLYRAVTAESVKNPFAKGSAIRHISIVVLIATGATDCPVEHPMARRQEAAGCHGTPRESTPEGV